MLHRLTSCSPGLNRRRHSKRSRTLSGRENFYENQAFDFYESPIYLPALDLGAETVSKSPPRSKGSDFILLPYVDSQKKPFHSDSRGLLKSPEASNMNSWTPATQQDSGQRVLDRFCKRMLNSDIRPVETKSYKDPRLAQPINYSSGDGDWSTKRSEAARNSVLNRYRSRINELDEESSKDDFIQKKSQHWFHAGSYFEEDGPF